MGFNTKGLTVFHKAWFNGSPQNAKKANATLTFSGLVVVAETVTVGGQVYEFVAAAEDIADPANIPVVVGVTLTADNAVTKLAAAINANSTIVTAEEDTDADTCVITYNIVGTEGNSITISTDCTNATFGVDVTNLSGGQFATPCNASSAVIVVGNDIYFTDKPCTKYTVDAWYQATPTLL